MATVINNPADTRDSTGTGVVVGVLAVILLIVLALLFGLPYLRNGGAPAGTSNTGSADLNVTLPSGGETGGNTSGQ